MLSSRSIHFTMMNIAHVWAERSTCSTRIAVGVVIADRYNRIIASGYNGSPIGMPHCNEVGCILDKEGKCIRTIHAEENAIIQCATSQISCVGTTLYSTYFPCERCAQRIAQARIMKVIFENYYRDAPEILEVFRKTKIKVARLHNGLLQQIL